MFKGKVIVLEGLIGVGKSTLGRSLESYLSKNGVEVIWMPEPVNSKLLDLYISDMTKYAFPFQVIIARERIQMYKEAKRYAEEGKVVIIDRGLPGDLAFAYMQKDKGFFTEKEWEVYRDLISNDKIERPDAIIYLDCTSETAWRRIQQRGIFSEKNGYNRRYLKDLSDSYEKSLVNHKCFRIDWNEDQLVQNNILDDRICFEILQMCSLEYFLCALSLH